MLRTALRSNGKDLLAYLERRVSEPEDAADLLAETYLTAWRRVTAIPGDPEGQRMWLFVTARNILANARRAGIRRADLAARLRDHVLAERAHTDSAMDEERSAVRDAVERLPRSHRELVILVHWDGFTIAEAAHIVGVNPSTARSRYATARTRLRAALCEETGDPPQKPLPNGGTRADVGLEARDGARRLPADVADVTTDGQRIIAMRSPTSILPWSRSTGSPNTTR
jgi:RNA polymerase sigma-70 factor, ECF subfamily